MRAQIPDLSWTLMGQILAMPISELATFPRSSGVAGVAAVPMPGTSPTMPLILAHPVSTGHSCRS